MNWMAETGGTARRPARALARGALHHHARHQLRPRHRPAGGARTTRPRPISRLCAQARLSRRDQGRLKELARWLVAPGRRRGEGLRRHRAGDGKAARRRSRARLAGQAHQSRVARIRLVAVSRRDLHRRSSCRPMRRKRSLRHLPRAASTPARPTPSPRPTGSMRGAAFPISRSSTRAISRANSAPRWATASMAATIASRSARGTNSRRPRARRASRARGTRARRRSPSWRALDDAAFRALFRRNRRSSASAATGSCATC